MEQDIREDPKIVPPNAETPVKADTDLLVKKKSVSLGSKESAKNSDTVWWVNSLSGPCESRTEACKQRELVVETKKIKDGFDNCPHLAECRRKSEAK